MWSAVISAVGLLLVFEGILPFLSPAFWRRMMAHVSVQGDQSLRVIGLVSMLAGLALVCVAHEFYPAAI